MIIPLRTQGIHLLLGCKLPAWSTFSLFLWGLLCCRLLAFLVIRFLGSLLKNSKPGTT